VPDHGRNPRAWPHPRSGDPPKGRRWRGRCGCRFQR
jgi:hypothetical protein